jgi:hypothetical protein
MSFSNPQNDINPELANGCGSLALEDIWPSLQHTTNRSDEEEFLGKNKVSFQPLSSVDSLISSPCLLFLFKQPVEAL